MYNFITFWDSSFLSFTLCPNDCPLDSSEGRRQHSDCHHCVRAGRSHRLGYHRYGDQGRGRSFPEEGHHWEEVSEHTHTHACTCMNTCTDYGIQRDYQDHAPWEQTHLPLCKYCLPLLAHPSPCRVWLHHCQARLTTKARPLPTPGLHFLKTNTVWTIRNTLKILYQKRPPPICLSCIWGVSVRGLLKKGSHDRLWFKHFLICSASELMLLINNNTINWYYLSF